MKAAKLRGRARRTGTLLAASATIGLSLLFGIGPASAGAGHAHVGPASAPAEMHQLDFLLGNWTCVVTTAYPGYPVTVVNQRARFGPLLGGRWYQIEVAQPPSDSAPDGLNYRWVLGWNPVTSSFTGYYYDDHSGQGSSSSPGSSGGHIVFTGTYFSGGNDFTNQDDFSSVDRNHFVDHFSIGADPSTLIPAGTSDCHRAR